MSKTKPEPSPEELAAPAHPNQPLAGSEVAVPTAPPATPAQPGCVGYVDPTPLMSVTSDSDGYSPGAGVVVRKGSHKYTYAEAAALVSHGLGRVSLKERATLEAAGLLKPIAAETKE